MNNSYTIADCGLIRFPKAGLGTGNKTIVQNSGVIPFDVHRVYYLFDVPGGACRGAHAHRSLQQLVIAASGSFDVTLNDGKNKKTVHLNRPYIGLHICPGMWRDISNFSSGVICLVLASDIYKEEDYIRDYKEFERFKNLHVLH